MAGFADHFRKQELADHLTDADHLVGRTCLVTGANRGWALPLQRSLPGAGAAC